MVTFAAATKNSSSFPTRAPGQRRVDHFVAITCSDPNDSCDLYNDDCRTLAQLVSPSRDPIGYEGSPGNLTQYVGSRATCFTDPSGESGGNFRTVTATIPYFCFGCHGLAGGSCTCDVVTSSTLGTILVNLALTGCTDGPGISCCDKSLIGRYTHQVVFMNECVFDCMAKKYGAPNVKCTCW